MKKETKKPKKAAKEKAKKQKEETITFTYKNEFKGSTINKKEPPDLIELLRKQWKMDYGSLTAKKGINFYLLEGFIREALRQNEEKENSCWEPLGLARCGYALAD